MARIDAVIRRGQLAYDDSFFDTFAKSVGEYAAPFRRWSALHQYVEYVVRSVIHDDLLDRSGRRYVSRSKCSVDFCTASDVHVLAFDLMRAYEVELPEVADFITGLVEPNCHWCPDPDGENLEPDWDSWEDALDSEFDYVVSCVVEEIFYVLFSNRSFLFEFNLQMASLLSSSCAHDEPEYSKIVKVAKNGETRARRRDVPKWVSRAVFFRDRGRCTGCDRDLGVGCAPEDIKQLDHMVPLAIGGLNDVTNFQLLCKGCNNEKRAQIRPPGNVYDRWYSIGADMYSQHYSALDLIPSTRD